MKKVIFTWKGTAGEWKAIPKLKRGQRVAFILDGGQTETAKVVQLLSPFRGYVEWPSQQKAELDTTRDKFVFIKDRK